jgi:serine/threonine-protein kinase
MQQSVLAGRYRLERQLGKGGMGSVWLAEHLALRSWVAVKLMDPAIAATPEGAERFRREAQAAASLRSAHVVQVLDYGVHETTPFLVMELLQGESLASCLEREKRLPPQRTLAIITQVARALGRAHAAGIVHRDLKPDNVFLVREDDQELVKVLDFGIAKTPQAQFGGMETRTGVTMGTPYYMSPEQVEGRRAVDFRTDLWAMTVITSECMTGVRPFDGSTFGELLLNICARPVAPPSSQGLMLPGFDAWFARGTNRDAEQRFTSAQELATTLRDLVGGPVPVFASNPALLGSNPAVSSSNPAVMSSHPSGIGTNPAVMAVSASPSLQTAQPLEVAPRRTGSGALPWILLGATLLLGGVAGALLLLRSPQGEVMADKAATSPPSATLVTATPSLAVNAASPPDAPIASATGTAAPPQAAARANKATDPKPGTTAAKPATTSEAKSATSTKPTLAPEPAAPKTLRCFSDPFSGQVRPLSAGTDKPSFACRQDPFTGNYKKL